MRVRVHCGIWTLVLAVSSGCSSDRQSRDVTTIPQALIVRYDTPLTYAQARAKTNIVFPLPSCASNIYYASFGGMVAYTMLVRFDAPPKDCVKHIDEVLAWDNEQHKRQVSYRRSTVFHVDPVDAAYLSPAPWFEPSAIKYGVQVGSSHGHEPEIWVDLERGVFYFRETD